MSDDPAVSEGSMPFEPQPADLGGCGKPAVIGCLALLVMLALGLVVFLVKARSMLDWALVQYERVVVENLSEQVTDLERRRLDEAFDEARRAIRENRMDPGALQRLQRFMSAPPRPGQPIESKTVRELTEVLEDLAKLRVEFPDAAPVATPVSGMTTVIQHVRI